jgi:phosphoserine aminotransferase
MRVFNFSAGPAVLPESVLQQAAAEMLDWHGSGMSVMEMSHRGKEFISIADKVEADLRALLAIPANYKVLFLQGGAIAENAIVPMNLLRGRTVADYVHTGEWSKKSIKGGQVLHSECGGLGRGPAVHVCSGTRHVETYPRCRLRACLHERDYRRG